MAPNTRESVRGIRRIGPASGWTQASRPSAASTLVSVGGHSGPNHPAGRGAMDASPTPEGTTGARTTGDGRWMCFPSCGARQAPATAMPMTATFMPRRRARHRRRRVAASAPRRQPSEQKLRRAGASSCR